MYIVRTESEFCYFKTDYSPFLYFFFRCIESIKFEIIILRRFLQYWNDLLLSDNFRRVPFVLVRLFFISNRDRPSISLLSVLLIPVASLIRVFNDNEKYRCDIRHGLLHVYDFATIYLYAFSLSLFFFPFNVKRTNQFYLLNESLVMKIYR